jgi:C4-type Zn-finger protein
MLDITFSKNFIFKKQCQICKNKFKYGWVKLVEQEIPFIGIECYKIYICDDCHK